MQFSIKHKIKRNQFEGLHWIYIFDGRKMEKL